MELFFQINNKKTDKCLFVLKYSFTFAKCDVSHNDKLIDENKFF